MGVSPNLWLKVGNETKRNLRLGKRLHRFFVHIEFFISIFFRQICINLSIEQFSFLRMFNREAERSAREEVNTLKESIEVAKVKAESDTSSASMMIAR